MNETGLWVTEKGEGKQVLLLLFCFCFQMFADVYVPNFEKVERAYLLSFVCIILQSLGAPTYLTWLNANYINK